MEEYKPIYEKKCSKCGKVFYSYNNHIIEMCSQCYIENKALTSIKEIVELSKEDIEKNNPDVSAVLDIEELKNLKTIVEMIDKLEYKIRNIRDIVGDLNG